MRPLVRFPQGLAIAAAVLIGIAPLAAEPTRLTTNYLNLKYGFSLAVPTDVLVPATARNPDEGGLWQSRDGQARLIAVAGANASGDSLTSYRQFVMQQSYKSATFDYTPVRDSWFVLSGRMDGRMFYERITFACDGRYIYGWQLTYPVAERQLYDRIVESIHRSFRPGRGEDGRCGRTGREPT